jgi:hypothetical protein
MCSPWPGAPDRMMTMTFNAVSPLTVIVAYAPTEGAQPRVKDACWAELEEAAIGGAPSHHQLVILGDLNARFGADTESWPGVLLGRYTGPAGNPGQTGGGPTRRHSNGPGGTSQAKRGQRQWDTGVVGDVHEDRTVRGWLRPAETGPAAGHAAVGGRATLDHVLVPRELRRSVTDYKVRPDAMTHHSDHRLAGDGGLPRRAAATSAATEETGLATLGGAPGTLGDQASGVRQRPWGG